ncbi:receptor like protein 26-like [Gossypium arboreum]|uniref:receptor like protein 26-like n=1 Tax=Gossypium arboreum TaxID=29729 RepID=UPI0022F1DC22|nr:receptor like protein 26-like [Gossypium arboreum]
MPVTDRRKKKVQVHAGVCTGAELAYGGLAWSLEALYGGVEAGTCCGANKLLGLLFVLFFLSVVDCCLSLSSSSLNPTPSCLPEETSALLQFKNTMAIDDSAFFSYCYPKTNSWNESTNCCSWEGVTCEKATGQVISLDLSCSKLVGSLSPNTTVVRLRGLKRLDLSLNNFSASSISSGFNQLVSLTHLNLSGSYLSGSVPSDISLLSKLISLDLSRNERLKFDSHGFDMLTRNLSKLENLLLDWVNTSDVVPTSFMNLPASSLKRLSLYWCDLQGDFPSEIFQLGYLEYVDLSLNYLTGYLPRSNWSSTLKYFGLDNNHFGGSIPSSLGNLTKITYLSFSNNKLEGQIPDVFGNLNKLTTLDFSDCNFSGQLPPSMFNLTQLTYLDLSSNRLEGPLPIHVTGFQNLKDFILTDNLLTGGVPSWPFTLPSLEYLNLSNNSLTGPINQIQKPNSIQVVDLADNDIHCEIPSSFFCLSKLTQLDLSSNNLSGVIRSDMLLKLESLETLDLSTNNFSGVINLDVPSKLKNLTEVNLSNNKLRQFPSFLQSAKSLGSIFKWEPEGWEQLIDLNLSNNSLTRLEQLPGKNILILDLHSNLLQGPLSASPPSLQEFLISDNKLTGEIPPSICNLTSLHILDLSQNYFGGIIPSCLGNLSRGIRIINLQKNSLSGKIPDFCVELRSLTTLALNDNKLEGLLPRSLVNCTLLRFLNLANNTLNDLFPHRLSVLPELQVLILRSNRFYGRLDYSISTFGFSSLQILDLSKNEFTGPFPKKFFQSFRRMKLVAASQPAQMNPCGRGTFYKYCIPGNRYDSPENYKKYVKVTIKRLEIEIDVDKSLTNFTLIDFSNNRFSGRIPEALGELHALLVLNLSHNRLNDTLPPSLANMAALESLDLSSNKLGGRIPSELTKLTFLAVLNVSQNNFFGPIPVGYQFNTFDIDSYAGNLDLCGFPLSKKCGSEEERKPQTPKLVEDEDSAIPFIWKVVMMGYGCGVVMGLSTGYIVFTTRRPWWLVRMVERDWQRNFTRWVRRIGRKRN